MAYAGGSILECVLWSKFSSQFAAIVRHYRAEEPTGAGPTNAAILDRFSTVLSAPLKALMSTQALFMGASLKRIIPTPPAQADKTIADTGAGAVGEDILPPQVCGLISFMSVNDVGGVIRRGRTYVPFPDKLDSASGSVTIQYSANLTAFAVILANTILVGNVPNQQVFTPVILRRSDNTVTVINDWHTTSVWATQRRRGLLDSPDANPFLIAA